MAVALSTLVRPLELAVNPPGADLFPDATETEWIDRLANAFWDARIEGFLTDYTLDELDIVAVTAGADDMPRDLQQVVVFFAAFAAVAQQLRSLRTSFRAKAGPVEFETQQSAAVLAELQKSLEARYQRLLDRLSDQGLVPDYVIDAVCTRLEAGTWIR